VGLIDWLIKKKVDKTVRKYTPRLIWSVIVIFLLTAAALTGGIWIASKILTF